MITCWQYYSSWTNYPLIQNIPELRNKRIAVPAGPATFSGSTRNGQQQCCGLKRLAVGCTATVEKDMHLPGLPWCEKGCTSFNTCTMVASVCIAHQGPVCIHLVLASTLILHASEPADCQAYLCSTHGLQCDVCFVEYNDGCLVHAL